MSQHLQREIDRLKRRVLFLGALVEEHLHRAVESVEKRSGETAARVIASDVEIDNMEVEVEEECLKMLALYQPVAADLRFIVASIKINNDLERIGDLAVNVAEDAAYLATRDPVDIPSAIARMVERSTWMLRSALDALVNLDAGLARAVCAADDDVDALDRQMFERVGESIQRSPERFDCLVRLLSISRQLERVGDHATNIAEDVIYMTQGDIVRHKSAPKQKIGR